MRVEAECPRPRKSRSGGCGVSTDRRFSSACDREPPADTALRTRTWRRAGRLRSPVAGCAFDSPCVRDRHGNAERDAVHLHLRRSSGRRADWWLLFAREQTRGGPRGVGGGRCLLEHPSCRPTGRSERAFADGADAWLPRPRTARPGLNTNDITAMRD